MKPRKKVVWNPGVAEERKRVSVRPHPFIGEQPIFANNAERWQEALLPGALWSTVQAIAPNPRDYYGKNVKQHELSYVNQWYSGTSAFPAGAVAIYAGTVRVSEEDRGKRTLVSIQRHTFIIGGVRYMTTNLNLFRPVG